MCRIKDFRRVDMAFDAGDDETFVRESRVASTLQADSIGLHLAEVAETGLRKGGRRAMLEALRNQRVAQFEAGVGGATDIGRLCALLGDYENARRYLRLGVERRETGALYSDLDPILRRIAAR